MKAFRVILVDNNKVSSFVRAGDNEKQIRELYEDYYRIACIEDITEDCKIDIEEIERGLLAFGVKNHIAELVVSIIYEYYDNPWY